MANWIVMPVVNGLEMTRQAICDCLDQTGVDPHVLVVLQGADREIRETLEGWAEREPRLLVWSHDPPLPSLSATWNRALRFVWEAGGTECLVVNNDVRLAPWTYMTLNLALHANEALFVTAVGVREREFEHYRDTYSNKFDNRERGGPDFSCFLISRACHAQYPFDEAFIPAYCVTPDTPVLTSRLFWIEMGDVAVGDELLGVDEESTRTTPTGQQRRCYRPAKVTHVERRMAPCLTITMADGRTVTCSTDHKWLTKRPAPTNTPYAWRAAETLMVGYRIATPLDVWSHDGDYNEGWLAGIIDGEGCLRQRGHNRFEVQIAQKPGAVLDLIKSTLNRFEIPYTSRVRADNSVGVVEVAIRRHALRLLGKVRPTRLLNALRWEDVSLFSRSAPMDEEIVSIEPAGEREVVTIETTARTYIANGMIAHNCEDLDYHRRLMLGGDGARIFSVNLPYLHYASQTVAQMSPEARAAWAARSGASRAHYRRKWGGDVNEEQFMRPFDPTSARAGYAHTPELQRRVLAGEAVGETVAVAETPEAADVTEGAPI